MTKINLEELPTPDGRFDLAECLGTGLFGKVHKASDSTNDERYIALKIQNLNKDNEQYIVEELKVLKDFSNHLNLPDFYGAFRKETDSSVEIWFALEVIIEF